MPTTTERYCIVTDDDHEYVVPVANRLDWYTWLRWQEELGWPGDDPPEWAQRMEGNFTFSEPKIGDS